ncbi:MAG: Precorrin-2 oxidase @ Sirohydrochlorin ferrochelatase activity of CysG / Uroporphyrinogen-III methyltransferase [uncultured Friedmanniella sp.]|uniref:precorrin-2 dehydrogenase n=1 Tax=uncultured Friedmanniella sp. TaxID=335381 RepID=A0A6J4KNZ1_9ACTN|nr:bifunctional precorrin-2 dehydrogenase/sirohydrochlorin ferrochelatase [uncultured Friedmanniella sp.]CAA9311130.1 MAG: Precorrin-2 oxidase @ Sirohydrochlorin ferrochelatase activity of CysG / Uroporphyrinogen-III methyltransferase [uncultured Friedmanniella sp.]
MHSSAEHAAPYLTGLRLAGRRVVIVGGGEVASRRAVRLLEAGADLWVVAPETSPRLAAAAARGELTWVARPYRHGDLAEAWYVLAATDDEQANRAVSAEAEALRVFCVRADRAEEATAWTPATGEVEGVQVAVLAGRRPREAARLRDLLVGVLTKLRRRAA